MNVVPNFFQDTLVDLEDVTVKTWFNQWVAKIFGIIKSAHLDGMKSMVLLQIQPELDDEKTFARKEWPIFLDLLETAFKEGSDEVQGITWDDIEKT